MGKQGVKKVLTMYLEEDKKKGQTLLSDPTSTYEKRCSGFATMTQVSV